MSYCIVSSGVTNVKCNLDPAKGEINDPCSIYNGVCGGQHCRCPPGTVEDKALKNCKPGKGGEIPYGMC